MTIIAVLNSKGGCGKTTISTNLARSLQKRGYKVLLVDTDHAQASARDGTQRKKIIPCPALHSTAGITLRA